MICNERSDGSKRKPPPGESFRTDQTSGGDARSKTLDQVARSLQRFSLGLFKDPSCYLSVVCQRHTAAVGVNSLQHLKAEKGGSAKRANRAPSIPSAGGLSAIFDHDQGVLLGETHHFRHVTGLPVKMGRYDCASMPGQRGFDAGRIQIKRCGINIDKDRFKAGKTRNLRNDPKGQCRKNYFALRREVERSQHVIKSHASERSGNRMVHTVIFGKPLLEFFDGRTFNGFATPKSGDDFLFVSGNRANSVASDRAHHVAVTFLSASQGRSKYSCKRQDHSSAFCKRGRCA